MPTAPICSGVRMAKGSVPVVEFILLSSGRLLGYDKPTYANTAASKICPNTTTIGQDGADAAFRCLKRYPIPEQLRRESHEADIAQSRRRGGDHHYRSCKRAHPGVGPGFVAENGGR